MKYTYVICEDSVTLINLSNGNKVTVFNDDIRYEDFKTAIIESRFEDAEYMDVKAQITKFSKKFNDGFNFSIEVKDGVGEVQLNGKTYPLADVITKKIIALEEQGFSAQPLVNFMSNLYDNPSQTAIDELFLFMQDSDLPWTEDGHFIAYKIVKRDISDPNKLWDIYTGELDNSVGKTVEMKRHAVDDQRNNLCSSGLHFCSKGYLPYYGASDGSVCVIVKINPRDVVSIPADYKNAKGRCCKYEVVGIVEDDNWRSSLSKTDYNTSAVVKNNGADETSTVSVSHVPETSFVFPVSYSYDISLRRWRRNSDGWIVSRIEVAQMSGLTVEQLISYEATQK
jgi:hypothetical protein